MSPVKKKISFLRSGTKIARSPIRKQKKQALPAEQEPWLTPLKGKKKTNKPVPAETESSVKPLKKSTKRKAKKPQRMDELPDYEAGAAAGAAGDDLVGAGLTEDEKFWALGLGKVILKKKGVLNKQAVRDVLLYGLQGGDSLPPGLGLRPTSPRPAAHDDDDCALVERSELEVLLMSIFHYLVVSNLSDFHIAAPKLGSQNRSLTLTLLSHKVPGVLSGSRSLYDLIALLKLLESHAGELFDRDRDQDRAVRFLGDIARRVSSYLDSARQSLRGNTTLLESCASAIINKIRVGRASELNVPAVVEGVVESLLDTFSDRCRKNMLNLAITQELVQSFATPWAHQQPPAPLDGSQQHTYRSPPPPPNPQAGSSRIGKLPGMNDRECRFPNSNQFACALCGKGSTPGVNGHRARDCSASPEQQQDWIQRAIPVV